MDLTDALESFESKKSLHEIMGFPQSNDKTVEIANRILKSGKDALTIARIAKDIRRERVI
jgi:hypothetical protein